MKKKSLLLFIPFFFLVLIFAAYFYICNLVTPVSNSLDEQPIKFEIQYGASTKSIINDLKKDDLIKNDKICYLLARKPQLMKILLPLKTYNTNFSLKSGTYYLKKNMNIAQIFSELSSGKQEYQKVIIPEGLTISAIANILENNEICSASDFKKACYSTEILNKYDIPAESCEGYLFPETYFLNINMDATLVVELFIDTFFNNLKSIKNFSEIE